MRDIERRSVGVSAFSSELAAEKAQFGEEIESAVSSLQEWQANGRIEEQVQVFQAQSGVQTEQK